MQSECWHPDVARGWNNLGSAWYIKGEVDKAIGYYEKASGVFQIKLGPNHPWTQKAITNLKEARSKQSATQQVQVEY